MWNRGFEGWYFKHQSTRDTVALIPGRAESGAFVQMIFDGGSRQFRVPDLTVENGVIRAGDCLFSRRGCIVSLPGVNGSISYGPFTPLRSDIMGPFRFLPLECRHGVISMAHSLGGALSIDGTLHDFTGGTGYIETDRGASFPSSYLWLQCGDFSEPCSLMVSIARIPLMGTHFTGCICAIVYRGREYRLATYRGVRVGTGGPGRIRLSQGPLLLELAVTDSDCGHPLAAPRSGAMTGVIRESHRAAVRCRLWENDRPVFSLRSSRASFERAGY